MSQPPGPPPPGRRQRQRQELAASSLRPGLRPTRPPGAALTIGLVAVVLWLVVAVDATLNHRLLRFGIKPRRLDGLGGILAAPVLHADASQLAANTIPLLIFGWIMLISGARYLAVVTAACWLASGLVAWLAAPSSAVVLGAGGVIFGWLGYVLARAWFGRQLMWIGIAIAVLCVFSGMLAGLLPRAGGHTFWAAQLAGFVTGVALGWLLHGRRRRRAPAPKASGVALT
ncbi:MAG TPA: rhomboid family intramembrane serine protease [Jatrophihabitans sp.]|nr:rhomboid family intramembrane serine protease [Jatrophihabitans sp.]